MSLNHEKENGEEWQKVVGHPAKTKGWTRILNMASLFGGRCTETFCGRSSLWVVLT